MNVFMKQDTRFQEWLKEELWVGVHHPFVKGAVLAKVVKSGKGSEFVKALGREEAAEKK